MFEKIIVKILKLDRTALWARWFFRLANMIVTRLPAEDALKFLFELDARLYPLQGKAAVAYGGGVHIKHRLMRYHDFFVKNILPDQVVLDVGCGQGEVAHSVAKRLDCPVTGIDFNPESINTAQMSYQLPNLQYIHGDALTDLPEEGYDVVILSNVLEHFEKRPEFLQALRSKINPSTVLVRVPFFKRDWRVPAKQELDLEWRLDSTHHIEYDLETFFDEVDQGGYHVVDHEICWGEIWAVLREKQV